MHDRPNWDQGQDRGNWRRDGPPDRFDERNWSNQRGPRPRGPPPGPRPPGPGGIMGMPPEDALIPKAPYYDLPAGLMAPLVNVSV